jgi:hypothetical protein
MEASESAGRMRADQENTYGRRKAEMCTSEDQRVETNCGWTRILQGVRATQGSATVSLRECSEDEVRPGEHIWSDFQVHLPAFL